MSIIQLYAKKSDLIFSEPEEGYEEEIETLTHKIKENGMKMAIKCKPNGYICRGNTRVQATEEEFIPIDLGFFIGLIQATINNELLVTLRRSICVEEIEPHLTTKPREVKPPNKIVIPLVFNDELQKYMIDLSDEFVFLKPFKGESK